MKKAETSLEVSHEFSLCENYFILVFHHIFSPIIFVAFIFHLIVHINCLLIRKVTSVAQRKS